MCPYYLLFWVNGVLHNRDVQNGHFIRYKEIMSKGSGEKLLCTIS